MSWDTDETRPRVAIVTGAARGIGAATVIRLAQDGWRVLAVDMCADDTAVPYHLATREDLDRVIEAASRGTADEARPAAFVADVRDEMGLRRVAEAAEASGGGLDAAIACAGVVGGGVPAWQTSQDLARAILDTNTWGVLALAWATIPLLLRQPGRRHGRFIAVSSAAAVRGLSGLSIYGASKAAVEGFVRGLAVDLTGTGVTANCVSPGSTRTPMLQESAQLYGLEGPDAFAAQVAIERLIEPSEVAAAISWLAGPESSAITGSVVRVDGGLTL